MTIPFLMVTALAIYGWIVLDDLEAKQPNELVVNVTGQQFTWTLRLPRREGQVQHAGAAQGPPGRVPDPHQGRAPLLLGARVPAQVRRRARPHHEDPPDARTGSGATRWSAPSCAASATRRCARTCAWSRRADFDAWLDEQKQAAARPAAAAAAAAARPAAAGGGAAPTARQVLRRQRLRQLPHARRRQGDRHRRPRPRQDRQARPRPSSRQSIVDPEQGRRRRASRRASCPRTSATSCPPTSSTRSWSTF